MLPKFYLLPQVLMIKYKNKEIFIKREHIKYFVGLVLILILIFFYVVTVYAGAYEGLFESGYTDSSTCVYDNPEHRGVMGYLPEDQLVICDDSTDDLAQILYPDVFINGYIDPNKLSENPPLSYTEFDVPQYSGKKSYMGHHFGSGTNQHRLQQMAITNSDGFRIVNGRYCVALGTHFTDQIGQYFDLILENETVIPCVLGDVKADIHTDAANIFSRNNCCSEFVVDTELLDQDAKFHGDCSHYLPEWNSPVIKIKVYDVNVLK